MTKNELKEIIFADMKKYCDEIDLIKEQILKHLPYDIQELKILYAELDLACKYYDLINNLEN